MSLEASMVEYYAQRAREYERIFHKPERQDDLRALRRFVAQTFAGRDVLEVACGTGYWTETLARSAASVLATDINDEVLQIAQAKAMDHRRVGFRRADAYALPKFSRQFTGGLAVFWWSHVPKARLSSFVVGFHRVLAPGARVVFIDNAYVEGNSTPLCRTDACGNTYQRRQLDDGSTYEILKNFPTEEELYRELRDLASEIRIQFLKYYWSLSYVLEVDIS